MLLAPRKADYQPALESTFRARNEENSQPYIVAAWFTPDYRPWAERFRQSLIEHGAPYDLIEVERDRRGWEATTRMKPGIVLRFMDRHPDKVLILSDVDAEVRGDLAPLAAIDADIALRLQCWRLRQSEIHSLGGLC
jgi:hypothetical protein